MSAPQLMVSARRRSHNSAGEWSAHRLPGGRHQPIRREVRRTLQLPALQVEQHPERQCERLPERLEQRLLELLAIQLRVQLAILVEIQVAIQVQTHV